MTKAEIKAILDAQSIAYGRKATLAELQALMPDTATGANVAPPNMETLDYLILAARTGSKRSAIAAKGMLSLSVTVPNDKEFKDGATFTAPAALVESVVASLGAKKGAIIEAEAVRSVVRTMGNARRKVTSNQKTNGGQERYSVSRMSEILANVGNAATRALNGEVYVKVRPGAKRSAAIARSQVERAAA